MSEAGRNSLALLDLGLLDLGLLDFAFFGLAVLAFGYSSGSLALASDLGWYSMTA